MPASTWQAPTENRSWPQQPAALSAPGSFGAYGNTVDIDHGRGIMTRYAHLSSIRVGVGDKVEMGERIGGMGSTGRSTGTHLHYEVRIDGQPVNPRPFVEASNYLLAFKKDTAGPALASNQ
jgi:murein DD-endopeptidase MepM/ murein hydrolase activator NlpD